MGRLSADFSGHVIVVTGASGNVGRAVVRRFAAAGAHMVCLDRSGSRLPELFPELAASDEHLVPADSIDVTDPESFAPAVDAVIARFGRIDGLMHTVGGYRAGTPIHETPVEDWEFMINLNARSVFVTNRAVIPHMLERGAGKIINVASRAALAGEAESGPYSAAKSAVVRLTEAIAHEVHDAGINVNCVLPGTIDTPENRAAAPGEDFSTWVPPDQPAGVFLFLASESARAITGASIPVYGCS